MSSALFTCVGGFDRQLQTAAHLLDRGKAHGGEDAAAMLGWRLIADMQPLAFQLRNVIRYAQVWPAKAIGAEPPADLPDALDLAGFEHAIAAARAYLAGLTADRFAGRDDLPLTETLGPGVSPTMAASRWLTGFVTVTIHFHVNMIYAILRQHGVPIGKRDLFAGGL